MPIIITCPELELDLGRGHPHSQSQHWVHRWEERKGKQRWESNMYYIHSPFCNPNLAEMNPHDYHTVLLVSPQSNECI